MFNYRPNAPRFISMGRDTIEGASKSPFSIAGKAMSGLEDAIDTRIYAKDAGNATNLEELMRLTPRTAESQKLAQNKMQGFNALGQQQNREALLQLKKDKYAQDTINADITNKTNQFKLSQLQDAQGAINTDDQYLANIGGLPEAQEAVKGLPSLGMSNNNFTAITPMNDIQRMNAESKLGMTGTFNALTNQQKKDAVALKVKTDAVVANKLAESKLAQARERAKMFGGNKTYMTLRQNLEETAKIEGWDADTLANEINNLNTEFQIAKTSGVGANKDAGEVGQTMNSMTIGGNIVKGDYVPTAENKPTRMKAELEYKNNSNAYTTEVKKSEASFYQADNTIKSITSLSEIMNREIKAGNFDTGMIASLQKNIGNMTPTDWRDMSGKTNEQIMVQAGLEGTIGMEVAERLRDMSGLAASDNEFGRTLAQVIGGDWTQEDVKLNIVNNFIDKIKAKNIRVGEKLVRGGLVNDVADVVAGYKKSNVKTPKYTEGSTSTSGGKPIIFTNGKWEYQ